MRKLFTLILLTFYANYGMAQGNLWERVTTTDNWDNDGVYMLTQTSTKKINSKNTTVYYAWKWDNTTEIYTDNTRYTTITENNLRNMNLFKILKDNNNWYLFDLKEQKYVDYYETGNKFNLKELFEN